MTLSEQLVLPGCPAYLFMLLRFAAPFKGPDMRWLPTLSSKE